MPSSMQSQNAIFGVTAGLLPKDGPIILAVPVTLLAGVPQIIDLHDEIANGAIDFVQAVFIDNSAGASPLSLFVTLTGHNIVVPTKSQGVFTVLMVPGGSQMNIKGPAGTYTLLFSNMPFAPAVWSAQ